MRSRASPTLVALVVALVGLVGLVSSRLGDTPPPRDLVGPSLETLAFEEVSFRNERDRLDLAGMLFLPSQAGPRPATVLIHGSGESRRDNRWYLTLVEHLRRTGTIVLLPDKRGSERSEGEWRTASFEALARDTVAAIEFLRARPDTAISVLGVIGLSQGGQIAPIVGSEPRRVDFVINVVGSALPFHDALVHEERSNIERLGLPSLVAGAIAPLSALHLRKVRQRTFWDAVGNFDPRPYWARTEVPSLALFGENDPNTPSRVSAENLLALANPRIEVQVYAGSGHALEDPPGTGNAYIRAEALERIETFVAAVETREGG